MIHPERFAGPLEIRCQFPRTPFFLGCTAYAVQQSQGLGSSKSMVPMRRPSEKHPVKETVPHPSTRLERRNSRLFCARECPARDSPSTIGRSVASCSIHSLRDRGVTRFPDRRGVPSRSLATLMNSTDCRSFLHEADDETYRSSMTGSLWLRFWL